MQEVFEKIKSEIRNLQDNGCFMGSGYDNLICRTIEIVNQVAEEYNQSLANNNQSLTNADKIRSMSNEELAKFLLKVNTAYAEPCMTGETDCKWEDYPDHSRGCKDCFEEWLQQEVEK